MYYTQYCCSVYICEQNPSVVEYPRIMLWQFYAFNRLNVLAHEQSFQQMNFTVDRMFVVVFIFIVFVSIAFSIQQFSNGLIRTNKRVR